MKNLEMKKEFKVIAGLLASDTRVLDVGCGDGSLMNLLVKEKNIEVRGLELEKQNVQECIYKGLPVIQGNAETELSQFPDKAFDFVILSQTLQAFYQPENVLEQLLRIGHRVIISIPNFGYWQIRARLLLTGKMPITKELKLPWYDTKNIHFCTIRDFCELIEDMNFVTEKKFGINKSKAIIKYPLNKFFLNLNSIIFHAKKNN